MKTKANLSSLANLILCMLRRRPQSGYALCKNIEAMPIGAISASPGSIYPCLKKLEASGHILTRVVGGSIKPRREYRISARGGRALEKWFEEPIDAYSVMRSPENLTIRLSFFDSESEAFSSNLATLGQDLAARKQELVNYRKRGRKSMEQGGLLALDLSIQMTGLLAKWSEKASVELSS